MRLECLGEYLFSSSDVRNPGIYLPNLTNMLHRLRPPVARAQIRPQRPPKQLQQHLETELGEKRIVAAFAQLVPDEGVLRVRGLVEGETDAVLVQGAADQIPAGGRDVGVFFAEDLGWPSSSAAACSLYAPPCAISARRRA